MATIIDGISTFRVNFTDDITILLYKVNRIEVIDENGRTFTNQSPDNKIILSFQDKGETLKVIISKKINQ